MDTEKASLSKNFILNFIYQILTFLTPFITTPYVSRVLGAVNIGKFSYTNSIITYLSLICGLGLSMYGGNQIAIMRNERDKQSIFFREIIFAKIIVSIPSVCIYGLVVVLYKEYSVLLLVQGITIVGTIIDPTFLFQGNEDFKSITVRNIACRILTIIYIFAFITDRGDINRYAFIMALTTGFVSQAIMWPAVGKYVDFKFLKSFDHIGYHIKYALAFFAPSISATLYQNCDKFMIGVIAGAGEQSGYYEQATKLTVLCYSVISSVTTIMFPRMSYVLANDKTDAKKYIHMALRLAFFITSPMAFGIFAVSDYFVPIFYGEDFIRTIPVLNILAPIIIIHGINDIINYVYFLPNRMIRFSTLTVLAGTLLNIILNLLFIDRYYAIGAAAASLVSEIMITVIRLVRAREIVPLLDVVIAGAKYVLIGFLMSIIIILIKSCMDVTVYNLGLMVFVGGIFYFVVLLCLKDKFLFFLLNKLKMLRRSSQ